MTLLLNQLNAVTRDYYEKRSTDILFLGNVLLYKLLGNKGMENHYVKASDLVDGGAAIREFLEHGEANSDTYHAGTTIAVNKKDILNAARFGWGGNYASHTIDLDDNVQNSGKEALVDIAFTKLRNIEKSIRKKMGLGVFHKVDKNILGLNALFGGYVSGASGSFSGTDTINFPNIGKMYVVGDTVVASLCTTGGNNGDHVITSIPTADSVVCSGSTFTNEAFVNLTTVVGKNTNRYGEIAEADMSLWKPNVVDAAAMVNSSVYANDAITFGKMQHLFATPNVGQEASSLPNLVLTTVDLKDGYERTLQVQQRFSDQKLVEAGFDNVLHKRAPVVADTNQAEGTIDCLNLNHLKIKTHKDYNFTMPKWEAVHTTPDTQTANTRWMGQMVTNHRKSHVRGTRFTAGSL